MENLNKGEIPQISQAKNVWNTSREFNSVGKAKIDSFKEIVLEIENMIEDRKILSLKFIKEKKK